MATDIKLTIFTPTYNRSKLLKRLYDSLKNQSSNEFVWMIVDDGSTDDTEAVVNEWIEESNFSIRYVKQLNQGKSVAHNKAVELTQTELFVCVDSDDYLKSDAVSTILANWVVASQDCVGILSFREIIDGSNIYRPAEKMDPYVKQCKLLDAYDRYGLKGDTMLIFKSEILKQYKFPVFEGEKFVPESYLYDCIDENGLLWILRDYLYVGEYQDGGYTSRMSNLIKENPKGYSAYIKKRLQIERKLSGRIHDMICFIAISILQKERHLFSESGHPALCFVLFPAGYLLYWLRYR